MAQLLNLRYSRTSPIQNLAHSSFISHDSTRSRLSAKTLLQKPKTWSAVQRQLKCNGRFYCLFSFNRKQDEAKKALESALDGKENEYEQWDKEVKKREEVGGGGDVGGGGWFGWGGRSGWSNGDNFWSEALQTILAVLGFIFIYLIVAKGEAMLAAVLNPLLFALREPRNWLSFVTSKISRKSPNSRTDSGDSTNKDAHKRLSAKERVVAKWGSD